MNNLTLDSFVFIIIHYIMKNKFFLMFYVHLRWMALENKMENII